MNSLVSAYLKKCPDDTYLHFHARRFSMLLDLLGELRGGRDRVLEVGQGPLIDMLFELFGSSLDTLDITGKRTTLPGTHRQYDLNLTPDPATWPRDMGPYDIILFSEVLEHLYTSPSIVLRFLNSLLADSGRLIIQTPNAAALHKRLKLLFGINPYERIREDAMNPGHFREYTRKELLAYARDAGFGVERFFYANYFDYTFSPRALRSKVHRLLALTADRIYRLLPGVLRPGMTCVLVKTAERGEALSFASS